MGRRSGWRFYFGAQRISFGTLQLIGYWGFHHYWLLSPLSFSSSLFPLVSFLCGNVSKSSPYIA
jgi:hypothetical protein